MKNEVPAVLTCLILCVHGLSLSLCLFNMAAACTVPASGSL